MDLSKTSSYRKSYVAWDNIERANKPKNYTKKSKYLSRNSQALLAVVIQRLRKKDRVILNHKYISTITRCEKRQNQNIIKELSNILDIKYKTLIIDNGKKHRHSYLFSLKSDEVKNTPDIDDKDIPNKHEITAYSIYKENNNNRSTGSVSYYPKTEVENVTDNSDENITPHNSLKRSKQKHKDVKPSESSTHEISISSVRKYPKPQNLETMSKIVDKETIQKIRSGSGRSEFTDNFILQTMAKLSKKLKKQPFFHSLKGFIAYMISVIRHEMHDAVKCSSPNFKFKINIDSNQNLNKHKQPATNEILEKRNLDKPLKPENLSFFGQIRNKLIQIYGEERGLWYDSHWFSKLKPVINEEIKTFKVDGSSEFILDWIKNNCSQQLGIALENTGYKLLWPN